MYWRPPAARIGLAPMASPGRWGRRGRCSRSGLGFCWFVPSGRSRRRQRRRREWMLLRRDPWLVWQRLMQLLYLLRRAVLVWRNFGDSGGALVLLVPVLVMAAGQLAGGLAWLTISGEDAPDLVASAPIAAAVIVRAKIEAVMGAVALVFAPFLVALAFTSPLHASVAAIGIKVAAAASTAIKF